MGEAFDEPEQIDVPTAGERLRAAREEKGLSLEDVAAQTRIPRRHLESLENSDWEHLPAPTYTTGFAKSYASVVGLDRVEIGDRLREEIGGHRPPTATTEVFEPADPARSMPKWLVFSAIAAVLLLVLVLSWLNEQSFQGTDETANDSAAAATAAAAEPVAAAPAPSPTVGAPIAGAPVVITANEPVWIQVYEKGGKTLFAAQLAAGQRYDVPPTATAPMLKTARPEAIRISVGTADAPTVGPAAATVRDVSLLGPDLMRGPAPAAAAPPPAATAPAARTEPSGVPRRRSPPAAPAPTTPPATQNTIG